jgi:biopolymer transport protein ExbD
MKRILEVCLIALAFSTSLMPSGAVQSTAARAQGSSLLFAGTLFAGTWQGRMNGLPGIDLTVREADKKIAGTVVFYFQERKDINSPWQVTAEYPVPLLATHVTGKVLTFEVEHHVCHGCPELGPNVTFRMELAGPDQARLWRLEEDGTEGQSMQLVRGNQASQVAPALHPGISVEMPVTKNATPVPDADGDDALIVSVAKDSKMYVGTNHVAPETLGSELQRLASQKAGQKLYVKADARAPYSSVITVLDAAIAAGVRSTVFLTSQNDAPRPRTIVPPKGLVVGSEGCLAAPRAKLSF